ncbi:MAG TPA: DUF1501 domain-containing protein [Thiolapillus brandeum]|uniref:DUF1501 domain-containing protein n=1 Tax=Thiolapillus brandeum TaxID=1076588 RepID=A0A831RZF5_9GAMM|nr:DUF1501 domain-containing protein [Thiolapillus brandeum]
MKKIGRRRFLRNSLLGAASVSPLSALLGMLSEAQAADSSGGYKALVCVLLEGGADAFNMVVPANGSAYQAYADVRGSMALARGALLPLDTAPDQDGVKYGFHPVMSRMQTLFNQQKLAVVANVGTLVQPVTRADVLDGAPVPNQLFSHNTQRDLWMTADAAVRQKAGWAARMADVLDPDEPLFNLTSGGKNLMQQGGAKPAFEFDGGGIYAFDDYYAFRTDGALGETYRQLMQHDSSHANRLIRAFAGRRTTNIGLFNALSGVLEDAPDFQDFSTGVHESGTPLGTQLRAVARMLSARDKFPNRPQRQVFFVNYHGWDTHNTPLDEGSHLVDYLDKSLGAFQDALAQLGMEQQVTTFTCSDFGRSITSNGAGTDHGWGGHAFVMGGAVRGGAIYGRMPAIRRDSPDAIDDRAIPLIAVEQYYSRLADWFGASPAELDVIFPNLHRFSGSGLEFMDSDVLFANGFE